MKKSLLAFILFFLLLFIYTVEFYSNLKASGQEKQTEASTPPNKSAFFYFVNKDKDSISKCRLELEGTVIKDCSLTGYGFSSPMGILFNKNFAYIVNKGSGVVSVCKINELDGNLENCVNDPKTVNIGDGHHIYISKGYAYITNFSGGSIIKCSLSEVDGVFKDCIVHDLSKNNIKPMGIFIRNGIIYITNYENNQINKCLNSEKDELLMECVATGTSFNKPSGVFLQNDIAYVVNEGDSKVIKCHFNAEGLMFDCVSAGTVNNPNPRAVFIYNRYFFISSSSSSKVEVCKLEEDGSFKTCNLFTDPSFGSFQIGMAHSFVKPAKFIYFVNRDRSTVSKCIIDKDNGVIKDCNSTGAGLNDPIGISVQKKYAYVVNNKKLSSEGSVTYCIINEENGSLTGCEQTPDNVTFNNVSGIFINNGFAYLTNYLSGVTKCKINESNGKLSECSLLVAENEMAIRSLSLFVSKDIAYISNHNGNTIHRCSINEEQSALVNCTPTTSFNFDIPNGVIAYNDSVYVVSEGESKVFKCLIGSDGLLSKCIPAAGAFSFNNPRFLSIVNGYAYVTSKSSSKVTFCKVNGLDGTFSDCKQVLNPTFGSFQEGISFH